jgi:type II secretory pathway component GspD/PulD (secretin)
MPIRDVILLLFRGTPFSIVFDPAVTGTFHGELSGLSPRQALDAVVRGSGFDYAVEGNLIRVFPPRRETRVFEIDYLAVRRAWDRRIVSARSDDESSRSAELNASVDVDPVADLPAAIQALLSESGRFHVDRTSGVVHVTDFPERLDRVGAYLGMVHVRATRQVRLDARVFEVALRDGTSVPWRTLSTTDDVEALMQKIAASGEIRLLGASHVLAMNNQPTIVRTGTLPDGAGLTLSITPQIAADGIVQLSVSPTYAERTGEARNALGDRVPAFRIAEADAVFRVPQGRTAIVSGLLHERVQTTPGRGFSGFFGAQDRVTQRVEFVVLLTPTVVTPASFAAGER